MRATIKDVAKKAGVSSATVSLAINQKKSRMSEETRAKVLAAARELNYFPNRMAVGLVTKKSRTIGLILSDMANLFSAEMANGIVSEARKHGYQVIIQVNANDTRSHDISYLDIFMDNGVDGVIFPRSAIINEDNMKNGYDIITDAGIPVITLDCAIEGMNSRAVLVDQQLGGYLATRHLIEYGHTKIGAISGSANYESSASRLKGYQQALEEAGIGYCPDLVYESNYRLEGGIEALPYLLGKGVTAIFAFNDMIALGVYKAIRNYGLSIPKDISIVGFDDIFISDVLEVPLTTVHQPIEEIGRRALTELLELINHGPGEGELEQVVFKPILKVRASTRRIKDI